MVEERVEIFVSSAHPLVLVKGVINCDATLRLCVWGVCVCGVCVRGWCGCVRVCVWCVCVCVCVELVRTAISYCRDNYIGNYDYGISDFECANS